METGSVPDYRNRRKHDTASWGMALLISILLHAVLMGLSVLAYFVLSSFGLLSLSSFDSRSREVDRVVRIEVAKEEISEEERERRERAFMKTSPDQEKADSPQDSAYIGERPTRAEGGPKAPNDMREMPAQDGEKPKGDEIVLFDQRRQDGDLSHEREGASGVPGSSGGVPRPPSSAVPEVPAREQGETDPALADGSKVAPKEEADDNEKDAGKEVQKGKAGQSGDVEGAKDEGKDADAESRDLLAQAIQDTAQYSDMMESLRRIQEPSPGSAGMKAGEVKEEEKEVDEEAPSPAMVKEGAGSLTPVAPVPPAPVYDPAFNPENQPGFRTEERKTRTMGRFSFGRKASMNVAATPTGRYEAIVYRAVAAYWYRQCDVNRDLIVTGTIRIRILVDKKGKVVDMRELSRSGASTVQKSFTLVAIQQAPIPAMPPEVVRELVGDKLEMIFDFHFE